MAKHHKGFDGKKRWGNSAMEGHGVNSPAMMEARAKLKKMAKKVAGVTRDRKMDSWRKETIKVHGGKDFKRTGDLKADAHRAIGIGYGYKDPMRTNKAGKVIGGKKYSYPIRDEKHLGSIKSAGGEYKLHKGK